MKPTRIATDFHWLAPNKIVADLLLDHDIALGDIWDLQNCKYEDVDLCIRRIKHTKERMGERYMLDNHELQAVPSNKHLVIDGICFVAACHIFWGEEKLKNYYDRHKAGAGFLKRLMISTIEKLKFLRSDKYSEDFKDRAAKYAADLGCHTIVMGHKHPKRVADFRHPHHYIDSDNLLNKKEIRIIVLTRGVHRSEDLGL